MKWEGPTTSISVDGETVIAQLRHESRIVRTTCVNPWVRAEWRTERPTEDGQSSKNRDASEEEEAAAQEES